MKQDSSLFLPCFGFDLQENDPLAYLALTSHTDESPLFWAERPPAERYNEQAKKRVSTSVAISTEISQVPRVERNAEQVSNDGLVQEAAFIAACIVASRGQGLGGIQVTQWLGALCNEVSSKPPVSGDVALELLAESFVNSASQLKDTLPNLGFAEWPAALTAIPGVCVEQVRRTTNTSRGDGRIISKTKKVFKLEAKDYSTLHNGPEVLEHIKRAFVKVKNSNSIGAKEADVLVVFCNGIGNTIYGFKRFRSGDKLADGKHVPRWKENNDGKAGKKSKSKGKGKVAAPPASDDDDDGNDGNEPEEADIQHIRAQQRERRCKISKTRLLPKVQSLRGFLISFATVFGSRVCDELTTLFN